jgi:hypothetical protein
LKLAAFRYVAQPRPQGKGRRPVFHLKALPPTRAFAEAVAAFRRREFE